MNTQKQDDGCLNDPLSGLKEVREWHRQQDMAGKNAWWYDGKHKRMYKILDDYVKSHPVKSISDEIMDIVDRLGSEANQVDSRAWEALAIYTPRIASTKIPDGYTAVLSDGKRYWSNKPCEHGDWIPYYLSEAPKPEKE